MSETKLSRKAKIKRLRTAGLLASLLVIAWLGYQLANIEKRYYTHTIANLNSTITNLNAENHVLTEQLNRHMAELSVCNAEQTVRINEQQTSINELSQCQEQVQLYQHVMAPELSGNMLSVDMVSLVQDNPESSQYRLSMILLQPRLQKAVISGDLAIAIRYEDGSVEPVGQLTYRFKFFQQAEITLNTLPQRIPQALVFTSDIVQYKRVREQLNLELPWTNGPLNATSTDG